MIQYIKEEELFDMWGEKWKDLFPVSWCHQCDTAVITCPECKNSSCNGGGCAFCVEYSKEWDSVKSRVSEYLTLEHYQIYLKGLRIQKFIKEAIRMGDKEINWNKLSVQGQLSKNDREMFKEFFAKE